MQTKLQLSLLFLSTSDLIFAVPSFSCFNFTRAAAIAERSK